MHKYTDHFKDQFLYTCLQCGRQVHYVRACIGCPRCKHTQFKIARRGTGYPEAFTPPDKKEENPYIQSPIMIPGDEVAQGGFGTRARGKEFPTGFSASEDLGQQREQDIPNSRHMFIDEPTTMGEGVNDGTFYDPDSPLSTENMIAEELFSTRPTPVGPHNMQKYRSVFDRVRRNQKGARYNAS